MPEHIPLEVFRRRHFDYGDGHMVGAFGPTQQAGKTTLFYQLLDVAATPERPAVTLCMKHRDRVIAHWSRTLGFREVPSWPPVPKFSEIPALGGHKPRGYTLWPPQTLTNVPADNDRLAAEFMRAITHNRKITPSITHANELRGLIADLNSPERKMRDLLTAVLTRDSVAGHGLWYENQAAKGTVGSPISSHFFDSAEHMFFARDGVEGNRRRYGEIGCGIDPAEIERQVLALKPFSWLYIRRSGPEWCVVDAYDERLAV